MCPPSISSSNRGGTNDSHTDDDNGRPLRGSSSPPRVAVIGCGPGGMFFLHHVSERRRKLEEAGDIQGLKALPQVTVMERNWVPGGVWCPRIPSSDDGTATSSTNMYEGLWINACKELFEFYDYTFDEHFGRAMPAFLPRKHVLEYLMGRITKNNPSILDDVEFGTTVDSVEWIEESQQFVVTSTRTDSGRSAPTSLSKKKGQFNELKKLNHNEEKKCDGTGSDDEDSTYGIAHEMSHSRGPAVFSQTRTFDKVIWAAGVNGTPKMIDDDVLKSLKDHFSGKVIHSSQVDQALDNPNGTDDHINNRRILLIGDSYSAEDLALQFVKLGAAKVYISSRTESGIAAYMESWPMSENCEDGEAVEILSFTSIVGGDTNNDKRIWFDRKMGEGTHKRTHVDDIDLVVLCTGYGENEGMLQDSLYSRTSKGSNGSEAIERKWSMPKGWKMKPSIVNGLLGGDIEPSESLDSSFWWRDLFRCVLIQNPNLMFVYEVATDYPLMEIDLKAHMCLNFVIDPEKYLPTPTEMVSNNERFCNDSMDHHEVRYYADSNYHEALCRIPKNTWYNYDVTSPEYREFCTEWARYQFLILGRDMADSDYSLQVANYTGDSSGAGDGNIPKLTSISDYELNEIGKQMLQMTVASDFSRYEFYKYPEEEHRWRTFRDTAHVFQSVFTGTKSVPLPGKWMELDDDGEIKPIN